MLSTLAAAGALALAAETPIASIQGAGHRSPLTDSAVTTRGVVTTVTSNGFYLQDPLGDGDDATSDGLFVYASTVPTVLPGDDVAVDGTVVEFLPGGDAESLTITEIHLSSLRILARGRALPFPVLVGGSGRIPPREVIDDDGLGAFDPAHDGIDFWESLEGMRVRLAAPRVVHATNGYGELWVVADGAASGVSVRGTLTAALHDANPERVQIDDVLLPAPMPAFDAGDALADVVGVVDYRFGCFEVLPPLPPVAVARAAGPETVALPSGANRVTVATLNVRNLTPSAGARVARLAETIVQNLASPAIVALQEIQDSSGPVDDGVTHATATLDTLRAAIARAGGPAYGAREVAPDDGSDGGEPGGNIRVALLFDPARVAFVDRGDPSAGTATAPAATDSGVALTVSPGRVEPLHPAWLNSRKPLAAELRADGVAIFLVVCHFSSRAGTTPEFGVVQPPHDPRAAQRFAQAAVVRDFVQAILRVDAGARVIVAGDFNDDVFAGALAPLSSSTALYDLHWRLPAEERWSYLFDGNGHAYDRILLSPALVPGSAVDVVHVNAGFANAASDHDPVAASVVVHHAAAPTAGSVAILSIRPNPSAGASVIEVDAVAGVSATVYDARGRLLRRLAPAAEANAFAWDGKDDTGRRVASGVYFVRVAGARGAAVRRIVRVSARE